MKKQITISQYNELFHIAENKLAQSWRDLGLSESDINTRSKSNQEFKNKKEESNSTLPESYYLYKKNANQIVDEILEALNIEVKE